MRRPQFRRVIPLIQTVVAVTLGGWGLWLRNAVLSQPFFGSTLWNSTARFHVWPWPFKFVAIVNMPAFVIGGILAWPLDFIRPNFPEWVSGVPTLVFVLLLWSSIGAWVDKKLLVEYSASKYRRVWCYLAIFMFVCSAAASVPESVGGHTSWFVSGLGIWLVVGLTIGTLPKPNRT